MKGEGGRGEFVAQALSLSPASGHTGRRRARLSRVALNVPPWPSRACLSQCERRAFIFEGTRGVHVDGVSWCNSRDSGPQLTSGNQRGTCRYVSFRSTTSCAVWRRRRGLPHPRPLRVLELPYWEASTGKQSAWAPCQHTRAAQASRARASNLQRERAQSEYTAQARTARGHAERAPRASTHSARTQSACTPAADVVARQGRQARQAREAGQRERQTMQASGRCKQASSAGQRRKRVAGASGGHRCSRGAGALRPFRVAISGGRYRESALRVAAMR